MRLVRRRPRSLLAALIVASFSSSAFAQQDSTTGALERFQPSAAGDALFGVPSPSVGGHLVPRGKVVLDFNLLPLSVQQGGTRSAIVSQQTFLHLNASLPIFDRVLFSIDMPFALAQSGDSPTVAGVSFSSPSVAQVGDLRLGARVRILGKDQGEFQLGAGTDVYTPTGPDTSYAAEGAVRFVPHAIIGGRYQRFFYNVSAGATLRAGARPHTFDARMGAGWIFGKEFVQVGPEFSLSTPFSKEILADTVTTRISAASAVSAELLFGAKVRPLPFLVVGAGLGPGLTQGYGTPVFFAVGSVGYEPLPPPPPKPEVDTDHDKIPDPVDACPSQRGVRNDNPKKNGCPADTDNDNIWDADDACPKVAGIKSSDPKKNGCPPDTDGDGILNATDACPDVPGVKNDNPKKNGCPPDTDGDGILDADDACPKVAGVKSDDPKKNGCPPDTDGDGIADPDDACPDKPGPPDTDPKQNGCPLVTVTKTEIVINRQVRFLFGQSNISYTVDPVSNDLLTEVKKAIVDHPEIELIEVQGHADNVGTEEYNKNLSQGRADAVRAWLIKRGIPPKNLIAKGYGATVPIASNDTVEGRQQNRRVQFLIIKKKKETP